MSLTSTTETNILTVKTRLSRQHFHSHSELMAKYNVGLKTPLATGDVRASILW